MKVVVASHPSSIEHDTGEFHPERPDRVRAMLKGIDSSGLDIIHIESPEIRRSELALVHDPSYIEMIERLSSTGGGALDMDTVISKRSWKAALTAAGGVRAVVEELKGRSDATGLAVTRPPGHHAFRDRTMGFCVFNNVAVSTALLRADGNRVAILDWDVHHGNGTQDLMAEDPGVLYMSIHQSPFYPYEGQVDDINNEAKGTTVNIPVPAGTAGDAYRRAWGDLVVPVVAQFEPDWVFISSGFDAHALDPLADMALVTDDYGWMASRLVEVVPANRVVVTLEGGYSLEAIEKSTAATFLGLAGLADMTSNANTSPGVSMAAIDAAAKAIAGHWSV
ncbi:MAG: histone deacetylase [Actinomycetota bacterium]|nr:histone deacetylase [Actinomycetota bacterium]